MTHEENLEDAKRLYKSANADQRYVLKRLFPELKESEDEKIRKEIITYLSTVEDKELIPYESWVDLIEKQGEQKPIEREEFTSIPFGAYDSELVNETITIPDGCLATIEGNRIHIKKKDKSATEAIKLSHIVDNNEMVESNFKAGD